jgi:Ice-binding-like/Putative Ig domain
MFHIATRNRRVGFAAVGLIVSVSWVILATAGASEAATTANGPINLGSAQTFGVLGASDVTNTGLTVINGDIGVSPGSSITGFGPGTFTGTEYGASSQQAPAAQGALTSAFNTAASLTPTESGLGDLTGLSLTPGVYSGGALSLAGNLTLAGNASSVWVFQAASTLITGSNSSITMTGGASECNVFWEIGSSATLGSGSLMRGTIMAKQSITAVHGTTVIGRLLANTGAVTLDTTAVTVPTGCAQNTTVVSTTLSPAITSAAPTGATAGTPYSYAVTATGTPAPTFSVSSGALPAGLTLNTATGVISGTPTTSGQFTFTITASNGVAPSVAAIYTIAVAAPQAVSVSVAPPASGTAGSAPTLPDTGTNVIPPLVSGSLLILLGGVALAARSRYAPRMRSRHREER